MSTRLSVMLSLVLCLAGCDASRAPDTMDDARPTGVDPVATDDVVAAPAVALAGTVRYDGDSAGSTVILPAAIVRGLGTDELVLSCATGTRDGVSQFAADWVGVNRLDLNGDGRADWIVHGRNACLRQPEAAYWWIYADTADTPRLLLRAEPARTLEVLSTSTHGFRDLRVHLVNGHGNALVADTRYDGQVYQAAPP